VALLHYMANISKITTHNYPGRCSGGSTLRLRDHMGQLEHCDVLWVSCSRMLSCGSAVARCSLVGQLKDRYTVGRKKKAPVGKSETLLFIITRGILNEFFANFFA
jgi:hypothetical protein